MEGNSGTDSRSADNGVESLQLGEEIQRLVMAPETGNSFTALLELPPNQAMELLHAPGGNDETPPPFNRLLRSLDNTPTFPSNAELLERAAVFSVFAAENSMETSLIPGKGLTKKSKSKANETSDDGEKLPYVHVRARRGQATDSHSLAERARREKINARMKLLQELVPGCNKGKGLTKKSKSKANETSDDGEKLPYVHVRARRGQATDSHSLAERARREKINARMKLLQELVPGCNKVEGDRELNSGIEVQLGFHMIIAGSLACVCPIVIPVHLHLCTEEKIALQISGTAMVLDEIINHVQSLQRQVEVKIFPILKGGDANELLNSRTRIKLHDHMAISESASTIYLLRFDFPEEYVSD
ncbi:hypothetical protein C3L33_02070, partial [Rhododendron williamsianum]